MAGLIISSGITSSGFVIVSKLGGSSYNSMTILDGGTASDTMVSAGGRLFVSSGGMASCTTVNGGYMLVSSGGTADDLVIGPSGNLSVFAGGSAIKVTENGGFVLIENGAEVTFAPNTISGLLLGSAHQRRSATVHSGTTATDVTIESGSLSVFEKGIVCNTLVGYNGSIILSSGGKLTGHHIFNNSSAVSATSNSIFDFDLTHLAPEATALVNNLSAVQGTPTYTLTVDSNVAPGFYFLAEGVSQFNQSIIVVNTEGTDLGILSLDTTVLIDGIDYNLSLYDTTLCLSVGGAPRPNQFEDVELLNVSKTVHEGEVYNNTTILSAGELVVSSGGVVNNTVVNSWGDLSVLGGVANGTIVNSSGGMLIASGGIANNIIVQSRGGVEVYDGGTANNITLDEYSWLYIYDGAVDNVSVNKGTLSIEFGGGTATNIDWTPCEGRVEYRYDAYVTFVSKYSGVYYGASNQLLSQAQLFESKSLGSSDIMYVMSGGTASHISGSGSGWYEISIWDGGVMNDAVISSGMVYILSGGTANNIDISMGDLWISSGGVANSVFVNASSWLFVESGGTATNVFWTPCVGTIEAYDGGVSFAPGQHSGVYYGANNQLLSNTTEMSAKTIGASASMFVMQDGVAKQTTVNGSGSLYVCENGLAESTIVNTNGGLRITSGGTVTQTTISGGWGTVAKGGSASVTTLNNSGRLYVENGGRATDIVINNGGSINVSSGGTATNINAASGAYLGLTVTPDTYAQGTYNGNAFEVKDGLISGVTISSGYVSVSSGGRAESVIMNKGSIYLYEGGVANNTTINSAWFSIRGGEARNTTVNSGGSANIYSGGKLTGKTVFNNGAKVSAYTGASLDFNLIGVSAGSEALVNNLSIIQGTPTYYLKVDGTQENGDYILAEGATGFDSPIFIVENKGWTGSVMLYVGKTLTVFNTDYTLSLNDGSLVLSIFEPVITSGVVVSEGTCVVSSGELYQETFVDSGGILEIASGGRTKYTQIGSNSYDYYYDYYNQPTLGEEIVSSGGYAEGTVAIKGSQTVYGLASGTVLSGMEYWDYYYYYEPMYISGCQNIESGGTAIATRISSGAQGIGSSGLAIDTVMFYGSQYIASGGVAQNTWINSGNQYVANGGIASGNVIRGGWHYVYAGGSVSQETISSGYQYFSGYGDDIDIINGYISIAPTASVQNIQLHSGASMYVSGGSVTNLVQESEGRVIIDFRGNGFIQGSNQYNTISLNNRIASGFVYYAGAIQNVESGGTMLDPVLFSGAIMNVRSTGMVSGGIVAADGYMYVSKGASVSNTTINRDGCVIVAEGSATGITVLKGGNVVADFNAHIAGTSDGSAFSIQATNTTEDFIVLSGYTQIVDQGKTALWTKVKSGGCQVASSGGTATRTEISYGGSQFVSSGATVNSAVIRGGYQYINSGTIVSDTVIYSGVQVVYSGAKACNAIVSGGRQDLSYGASAIGTVLINGNQSISSGAVAENTTIRENGLQWLGNDNVYGYYYDSTYPASAKNTHVSQGGTQRILYLGLADGTVVSSGGTLMLSCGSAVNVQHLSGGVLSIDLSETYFYDDMMGYESFSSYAFASGTNVKGDFSVVSGTATNLILYEHASLYVGYGMSAIGTTISSGGILSVQKGGTVLSADIEAGGQLFCSAGGSFVSGHVASGGLLMVSGTHVSGVTLDKGAEVRLDFGGEITGTSNGQSFYSSCSNVISNFEIESGYTQTVWSGYRTEKSHIHSGGVLYVSSGGTATNILQDSGGVLSAYFESNGTNTVIGGTNESGTFMVSGGVASNLMLYSSSYLRLASGMVLSSSMIQGGRIYTEGNVTVSDIIIDSGCLYLSFWGNGASHLRNISIGSGGIAYIGPNSTIGGSIQVGGDLVFSGTILAENDTNITVFVAKDKKGFLTYLSSLSSISNTSFSIDVESGLNGRYSLAWMLPKSLPTFQFLVDGTLQGNIALDQSVFYNGARYTLTQNNSYLYLDITANVTEESVQLISGENVSYCGPVANDMRIVVGETQLIKKDGSAVNTLVDFGGTQDIESGGLANRTTVMSGGQLYVRTGANATSTTILAGGSTEISQGGSASFLNVMGGGMAEAAGTVDYAEISESGLLHLVGGAVLTGTITVSGCLTADSVISANGTRLMLNLNKETACLNQLDSFAGAYIILQVSAGETGTFKISDAAPGANMTLSVSGMSLSTATGDAVYKNNYRYQFVSDADGLNLEIKEVHTDFEVSDFIVPATFTAGETASFSWNLTNNGEMPIDGVRQSLYLVNADSPNRKTLLKSVYLTDLPGFGENAAQTMDLTWNDTMGYANSLFQVVVEADGDIQPDDNTAISTSQYHFEQKLSIEKLPDSFTENTGRIRVVARRTGSPDEALSAEIVLTDASGLVSTPQTVMFAAGESEKVFYLTVGDNAEYQGNADIQVGLQAQGYEGYSQGVTLTDDELPSLSFAVAAEELTEGDTFAAFGKVQLDHALDHDLRVKLAYDKTQLSGIPDYVVIKAGETEAAFALTVIDDATAEIDKTVKLTATADGVKGGTASLLIHDNDVPAIALSVNKTIVSEGDGVYALVGTITRTDNSTNYVKVKFADVDNSGLILPSTVTLGTGAQSVNFYIGIVDNALVDGDRTATVKANIYIDSCGCTVIPVSGETQVSFTILDNDGEALGLSFSRSNVAENTTGAARLTITRNTVNGDAMTVNLSVTGSSLLDLPESVQFEAGQNSVTIDVNTLTDGVNTGNQMAVVTASAEGYASAAGYLNISDVDLPDFVISEVSPAETPAYAGKTTLVNLTLANSGFQAYSGKVNVKLSLSNGTELGTYKVNGPFEVGETKQVGFYVNLPEITGTQTILAEVDPDNLISELNDGNNTAFSASFEVKLDYIVTVETEPEVLYTKAPITVTGTTKRMDGTAIGNMPVEVLLKAATGEKLLKTTSDAEGNYALTVDPSDLYAGSYVVYAGNLGSYGAAQDRVEIAGMKVNQSRTAFTWDVENRSTTEGSFTVSNLSGVALSGVTIHAVNAPDNFVFVSDGPAALDANGQLTVNYTITAAGVTEGGGYELTYGWQKIDFVAESDEGVTTEFSGYFYSNPQVAVLTLSETKDVRTLYSGKESFYEFQITNTGFGDTGEIHLNLPENDLIKIISNPVIENLAYGESATVTLKVNPVALGNSLEWNAPYTGSIGISAENANGTQFAFDYTFVTNDKGNITITLTDEWTQYAADHPMLSGAKVGVYNAYTEKLVTTGYTDENGSVSFSDLSEGKYILKYSANGHNNAQEVVTVRGGETLELNTFLQVSTVKYTWDVQRVELTDSYEIVLSTEFETNVPAPVVTISGPTVLPELAWGESTLMNFTVTNHGLIAAQDFTFNLPEIGNGYSWRVLNDQPFDLAPNSAATIIVLLERNSAIKNSYTIDGITYYKTDKNGNLLTQDDPVADYYLTGYDKNHELACYVICLDGIRKEYTYSCANGVQFITKDIFVGEKQLDIQLSPDGVLADDGYYHATVTIRNLSDTDAYTPIINLSGSDGVVFAETGNNAVALYAANLDSETPGFVSAGSSYSFDIAYTNSVGNATVSLSSIKAESAKASEPLSLDAVLGMPASYYETNYSELLTSLRSAVGDTYGSYLAKLSEMANSPLQYSALAQTNLEFYNAFIIEDANDTTTTRNNSKAESRKKQSDSESQALSFNNILKETSFKLYEGGRWHDATSENISANKKTVIIIHGNQNNYEGQSFNYGKGTGYLKPAKGLDTSSTKWVTEIASKLGSEYQILTLDWDVVTKNTGAAGRYVLDVATAAYNKFGTLTEGIYLSDITVIGHSYGAHIGGLLSQSIQNSGHHNVSRMIALDPATTNFLMGWDLYNLPEEDAPRWLSLKDLTRVEVYKSSDNYGTNIYTYGDVNFVVSKDGNLTSKGFLGGYTDTENHSYSWQWFIETINSGSTVGWGWEEDNTIPEGKWNGIIGEDNQIQWKIASEDSFASLLDSFSRMTNYQLLNSGVSENQTFKTNNLQTITVGVKNLADTTAFQSQALKDMQAEQGSSIKVWLSADDVLDEGDKLVGTRGLALDAEETNMSLSMALNFYGINADDYQGRSAYLIVQVGAYSSEVYANHCAAKGDERIFPGGVKPGTDKQYKQYIAGEIDTTDNWEAVPIRLQDNEAPYALITVSSDVAKVTRTGNGLAEYTYNGDIISCYNRTFTVDARSEDGIAQITLSGKESYDSKDKYNLKAYHWFESDEIGTLSSMSFVSSGTTDTSTIQVRLSADTVKTYVLKVTDSDGYTDYHAVYISVVNSYDDSQEPLVNGGEEQYFDDTDCVKETDSYYETVCDGIERHKVPHYISTTWCPDSNNNSNTVSYTPTNTSSSVYVPSRTEKNNGTSSGSINSPSVSTTCKICKPYVAPIPTAASPDGGMMSGAVVMSDSAGDGEPDSICAHVKVEFKQTAVMSREGFEGTLTLTNEAATEMTNITFTATVLNSACEDVSDLFEIAYNGTDGFSITQNGALEEYGLGNKGTGTFTVLYVPGRYTSTEGPEDYQFTGTISYTDSLVGDVSIDLTPITLTVNPSPSLQLHYFVERDVYADDPFTDAIEKSIPAEISVLVVNAGKGDARNFSLSGLTPEIVDNQKGLLLNYTMTDTAMNGVKNDNGIVDVNFGTVAANSSAVAQWWYETNIQGHYSDYSVNFTQMDYSYVDLYGNTRYVAAANRPDVSLIESADIHELIRSVQCGDDDLPDFLVDDLADDGDTPDTLYLSTGAVEDVNAVFTAVSNGGFGTNDVTITLTADFEEGWNYLRILDPGNGDYELTGIVRDGEALNARNFWQTDRYYLDELGVKYENRLHLLDYSEQAGTVEYTLTYTARDKNPLAVTSITGADAVVKSAVGSLTVTFNKAVNASSFTWADLDLFRQGDLANDLITEAVTVTQINSTTFEIGNLSELTAADGYYQLIVRTDGITDTLGNAGSDGKALNWTMAAAVPAVASIGGIDDLMNSKADSVEVTFTASVDAATLAPAVFRVNGASSDALVIAPVGESNTKFTMSGISGLLTEGSNVLEIDMTQVAGINGNTGLQASRKEWTIDLTAPAVQEISESLGVSGTAPAELVFEATEDVTVSADALMLKKDGVKIASDSMNIAIDGKKIIVTGINALSDGAYELELALDKIADAAGNAGNGTAVKTWTIDKSAPAQLAGFSLAAFCDLGESDSDGRTSTRDLTLVGTLPEAGLRVRIYQQTGTRGRTLLRELTPDGTSLETAVKVQGGHSTLIAELTDAAGNMSETSLSVFVDELAVSAEFQEKFEEVLTESPQSITFVLSEEVVGLTAANFTLSLDGENVPLDGMSIIQADALTYVLSGITASANGAYTLSLDMNGLVKKSTGLACSGIQSTGWSIYHADPPTIVSTSINSDQNLDGLATFSIVFSTAMNCDELIESGAIIQAVRIVEVDSDNNVVRFITLSSDDFQYIEDTNTLVWNSAAPFSEGGNYRLVLDTGMLKSEEGVSLAGSNAESGHSYQVSEPSEVSSPTQNGGYSVPVWYDYNSDGKLDLLVGEKATDTTGRIRVLLNTGTTESPVFGDYTYLPGADGDWTIAASNCLGVAPRFADVNGDGIDDLVYGTSDGRIEYALKSNGVFETGVSLLADGTAIDIGNRAVFDLVDWNGDGHLDIVSGAMDGKIYLFVNKGDWTFSAAQTLSIQLENGWSAPAVADLDGDGDLDVVSGDAKGNLYRFLNNGDGTFAVVDIAAGESDRSRPFICDVNGDGILDITVGYKSGKVSVLYGEKGSVVAEDFHINSSPVFSGTPSAKVEDYQVSLSWEPASDDFGVAGYKVRIGNTEYQTTGTTLTLADVDVGMYSYQVGAVDEAGLEGWSSLSTFEVKDVTPPVLNGLPSAKVWKNSVRFSWESASDNVAVAGYRIELNGQTYDASLTVQFVSGLELGDYEYRVGAIDTSGLITWSEKQSFTVTELADTLDHVLTETVPTANYGPGCVASSIGMLLGYYDKFGYCGFDVSDLISGEIELDSRNSADALLNTFIATPGYTSRFVGQSESAERPYTLTEQNELNTAAWDSLADWLGTGQKWRGNEDYATAYYYGSLDDVKESQDTYSVSGTALPVKFADFKYGLNLFVESVNYKLDGELTRTVKADTAANGTFSFADYTAEIDAGRGVLISLASPGNLGHMVLGYGYNEATGEIIFDDTTESGRRMVWNGTYQYAGHEYHIQSITTVVLDTDGLNIFDKTPPVITLTGDNKTPLRQTVLTATVDDGSIILYSTDNENWTKYTEALTVTANATYFFRATDEAGNEDTKQITFANIDTTAPVITLSGDNTTPLRESTLTATVDDGSPIYYRIGDSGEWMEYKEPITVTDNATYNFLSRDATGNEGTNFLTFANIDTVAPVITLDGDNQTLVQQATLTATVDDGSPIYYRIGDTGDWMEYKEPITVTDNVTYNFKATDTVGNEGTNFLSFENIIQAPGSDVAPQTQTWEKTEDAAQYIVEYSTDNFEHVIQLVVDSNSLDSFQMPAGNYKMRVKTDDSEEWTVAAPIVAEEASDEPKLIKSNADGHADVFFVNTVGTWESGYVAQHVGSTDDDTWEGTKEYAALFGKNKLTDIIEGSTTDANVLLMSDDAIGDALFVDDIYSASPDELGLSQSRIAQIDEIRAGAGNDVVDMTSQRFEYIGDGLTIRGGDGNDTIWANKGDNFLFGDAGNDRIIGASGNDVIVGGIGNDRMHGGGGNDIFTFCDNWGIDEVEQLGTGKVTLWFVSGDESKWNAETLTYIDGENSVKVKGVASVTLKFGDDGSEQYANLASAGTFTEFTSQRIFEESGKGLLA